MDTWCLSFSCLQGIGVDVTREGSHTDQVHSSQENSSAFALPGFKVEDMVKVESFKLIGPVSGIIEVVLKA